MRSLTRLGVAGAVVALVSTTALAGAAVAGAQLPDTGSVVGDNFATNSQSTLTSVRSTEGVDVTYSNTTERSLWCFGRSLPVRAVKVIDDHVKRYGVRSLTDDYMEKLQVKLSRMGDETIGKQFSLNPDGSIAVGNVDPGQGGALIAPGQSITWEVPAPTGYTAGALLLCLEPDAPLKDFEKPFSYAEYVSTNTSGGAGFGSSGSLSSLGS